ncbi:hypothetical protein ACMHYO_17140 [Allopusillimonas ginsengisoli]|uniref:hypothetical protein n=1 Tax=Allopusillimonas ginsengisoli TaxID=453575 RepID=UPI0010C1A67A|nr:hypothetical protein D7I39_10170 [Allopusillimonas ginsengisoli]
MSIQMLSRCSVALLLVALMSGCSSGSSGVSHRGGEQASATSSECRWNRSKCMYEGAYEPGERDYAEAEARRLNQASSRSLRRRSIR